MPTGIRRRDLVWMLGLSVALGALAAGDSLAQPARERRQFQPITVGQDAPDFDLVRFDALKPDGSESTDAKDRIKLSSWRGRRPVFIILSSYT